MAKWADYLIFAVRFNAKRTHIDQVRVAVDNGDTVGATSEHDRQTIVSAIKNGTTFVTIYKNAGGNWDKGKQVYIVPISGSEYLKTIADNKLVDNLDNLPEF
ncbi:hypothetical protein CJO91_20035 (plasmid) [Ralstonia solanacearum]|uniref:DUF3892 domain-containing protein n=1 Tax=Ralstonia pseudosolanacearum TaxID=1310165 RepID=UPI000E5929C6|nr:DUF3892 domain-containing protein [Ralstonia pseudosolanacearum]AXW50040.1 hypothetical protein CJO91_20035 [Ralstonia solanacearum]AXW72681.1 hypothetical protein CJO96_00110 [Ralstonia solanacearum]MBX9432141.1 DUF3892 domain-containing protein [Ralstonia pseudosolanacearum]